MKVQARATLALPRFIEIRGDDHWQAVDFVSDLHLSPALPRTFEAFERYLMSTPADVVMILGDLFDVWVGDDSAAYGFEADCLDVIAQAACRAQIGFMAGNRDFMMGTAALSGAGMFAMVDPTVVEAFGSRVLLTHGDALCLDDLEYQKFRRMVRDPEWQARMLAQPLAVRRELGRQLRGESQARTADRESDWFDVDAASAVRWLHEAGCSVMVHGHTHQPGSEPLAPGYLRHVLSDWDLESPDPSRHRAEVLRWSASGFTRLRVHPVEDDDAGNAGR